MHYYKYENLQLLHDELTIGFVWRNIGRTEAHVLPIVDGPQVKGEETKGMELRSKLFGWKGELRRFGARDELDEVGARISDPTQPVTRYRNRSKTGLCRFMPFILTGRRTYGMSPTVTNPSRDTAVADTAGVQPYRLGPGIKGVSWPSTWESCSGCCVQGQARLSLRGSDLNRTSRFLRTKPKQ